MTSGWGEGQRDSWGGWLPRAGGGGEGCSGDQVTSSGSGGEFGRGGRKAGIVEP